MQGHLYRSIERGFARLADKLGGDRLFMGPTFQQADEAAFGWPDLGPITGLEDANRALERIVEQGEGATEDWAAAHYGRFLGVLEDYLAMRKTDPGFEPTHPVVAAGMRGVERIEPTVYITDAATGGCSDLFNAVYELVLQMIARYVAFGHETPGQRQVLAHTAVGLMFQAIKPLGLLLACLPVGPDHPVSRREPTSSSPNGLASCSLTAGRRGSASPSASTNWPSSPPTSIRPREKKWWRRCQRHWSGWPWS